MLIKQVILPSLQMVGVVNLLSFVFGLKAEWSLLSGEE